jgi:protein-L-isoaspartate O-methyltransferase
MQRIPMLAFVATLSCRAAPAGHDRASAASSDASGMREPMTDDGLKTIAHAFFDAFDRDDAEAFAAALGSSFVFFDDRQIRERDGLVGWLRARRDRHAPARSRTYVEEHVNLGSDSAVYIGDSVEHYPPDGSHPSGDFDGWNTMVWVREAGGWRVASWQWIRAGLEAERAMWNDMYLEGRAFNPEPNKFVAEMVKGRKSGAALDVMMGQGRNAVHLASLGWNVTGIDIAEEGLRQARAAADARKLHIDAINADADAWDYGVGKWDLVVMTYAGCCDPKVVDKLRTSMRDGGLLIAEGFANDKNLPELFKDGFKVVRNEVVEDVADWGSSAGRPLAPQKLFRFAAERE